MSEHPSAAEIFRVRRDDDLPIVEVEHRPDRIPNRDRKIRWLRDPRKEHHECDDREQYGQQTQCASCIKIAEMDRSAFAELLKQNGRDQEAAENEEKIDSNFPAAEKHGSGVGSKHQQDRNSSHPIECRNARRMKVE